MSKGIGETSTIFDSSFTFPTLDCPRCDGRALDPERMYCHTCVQMLGIAIAEEAGEI